MSPPKCKRGLLMDPMHGQELFSFFPLSAQMCIEIGDNDQRCAREAEIMSTAL